MDNDWIFGVEDTGVNILWVGPGMGDVMRHGPWPSAISVLVKSPNPLKINQLKLLDMQGIPKMPFGAKYAEELGIDLLETERGDFFQESETWDIIIIDRIEAWMLGRQYWPTLRETPYEEIVNEWDKAIKGIRPFQVWVRHDNCSRSTIIPDLSPEYDLVVDVQTDYSYPHELNASLSGGASFWSEEKLWLMKNKRLGFSVGTFENLHVWQHR